LKSPKPDPLTLKELMQVSFNAGSTQDPNELMPFSAWWKLYGEERHDHYIARLKVGP